MTYVKKIFFLCVWFWFWVWFGCVLCVLCVLCVFFTCSVQWYLLMSERRE
jgi:hypothetical protein